MRPSMLSWMCWLGHCSRWLGELIHHQGMLVDLSVLVNMFRNSLGVHFRLAKALLVEIRADWVALKQAFQFPQQNANAGICWMCDATPQTFRDCKKSAPWRHGRLTAMSFHLQLKFQGKYCPLWSVPGVSCSIVIVDWLHCADLGIAADIMGHLLLELVALFPGQTEKSE